MSKPEAKSSSSSESEELERNKIRARLASGEVFLKAADKKNTTVPFRINFLKSKGFSDEEIFKCFEAVGQPQSMEVIAAAQQLVSAKPSGAIGSNLNRTSNQHHPHAVSPYFSALSPPSEAFGWKDYFIAITLGLIGAYASFKALTSWLPFEVILKRKDNKEALKKRERKTKDSNVISSPQILSEKKSDAPSQIEAIPKEGEPLVATSDKDDEIAKLKAELTEKTDLYTKIMREKAELTIKAAQAKAQQAQASRTIENANKKIADLEAKLSSVTEQKDAAPEAVEAITNPEQSLGEASA